MSLLLRTWPLKLLLLLAACSAPPEESDFYVPGPRESTRPAPPKDSVRVSMHPSGGLAVRWRIRQYSSGEVVKHGLEERFHPDGIPESVRHYAEGEPAGEWKRWYEDGTPRMEYTFSDEATPMRFYHPSGKPSAAGFAVNGLRTGSWTFWYPSGSVRQFGEYLLGHKHGEWTLRWESGGLRSRGRFRTGERIPPWKHWDRLPATVDSDWVPGGE